MPFSDGLFEIYATRMTFIVIGTLSENNSISILGFTITYAPGSTLFYENQYEMELSFVLSVQLFYSDRKNGGEFKSHE